MGRRRRRLGESHIEVDSDSHQNHVSAAWRTFGKRDVHSSRSQPEDHDDDDATDKAAKQVGRQVNRKGRGWNGNWQNVDEQLRAGARAFDMAVIKSELDTKEADLCVCKSHCKSAGLRRHESLAQAEYSGPLVNARASKFKKIVISLSLIHI